jgi:hypothetical protein
LKRTDEVEEWNKEATNSPTRRVPKFPPSESRQVLMRSMEPHEKGHGCPEKKEELKYPDQLLSRIVGGGLGVRDAPAGCPGKKLDLQKP